ncbi:MAG TPA: hypothetical protein DHV89_00320 [Ruminococcus sp.]|nr:hypothetical protein [Ruminococcus sp.]
MVYIMCIVKKCDSAAGSFFDYPFGTPPKRYLYNEEKTELMLSFPRRLYSEPDITSQILVCRRDNHIFF